jgi:hypothetical protein
MSPLSRTFRRNSANMTFAKAEAAGEIFHRGWRRDIRNAFWQSLEDPMN